MKQLLKTRNIDIALAAIVVVVLSFALLGAKALAVSLCLLLAYSIPIAIFRRMDCYTVIGQVALSFAFVAMSVFFLLNYWQSTVLLGTADVPYLLYDAQTFYHLSHDLYNNTLGVHSPITPYMGYPIFLSWWLHCGIEDIAYPVIINIFLLLCTMLLVARCCGFIMSSDVDVQRVSGYAMLLLAMVPGVMGMATLLAKEPFIIFALVACVCAMYAIRQRCNVLLYSLLLLLGLVILASMRTTYLYVLLLFVAGIWLYKFRPTDLLSAVLVVCAIGVAIYVGSMQSWWQDSAFVGRYVEPGKRVTFFCGDSQEPLQRLIGPYYLYPLWLRFVLLPVTVAVQFIIPFPFEMAVQQLGHPISMTVYHRMSYLWYLAAIPMLGYYLFYWWRKGGVRMSLFAIVAAAAYCIPAYMTAGSVSRYAFCFVPFLAILGGFVMWRILDNRDELKRLGVFAMIYAIVVSAALFIGANPYVLYALIK